MSASWFDLQPEEPESIVTADGEVSEVEVLPVAVVDEPRVVEQAVRTRARDRSRLVLPGVGWLVAGVMSVVFVVVGVWWAAQDSSDAASEVVVAMSSAPATTTAPAKRCPEQPEATAKSADGVFVKFQEAYFAGDTKTLLSTVDETSYLADVDWVTAAGEVLGSDFCVKVISAKNNVVDATTTVRTTEGEEFAFVQLVRVVRVGDGYRITSIEDKNSPNSIGKV